MCPSVWTLRRILLCAIGAAVTVCTATQRTVGQPRFLNRSTSHFDAYNNARPTYDEWPLVGVHGNRTRRAVLSGLQMQTGEVNRRVGLSPSSPLGDPLAAVRRMTGLTSVPQLGGKAFSPARAGAFSRFGRTKREVTVEIPGTVESAVERRRLLLSGSSRNEPIYRVLERLQGRGAGAHRTIATTPFISANRETPQPGGAEINLHDFLRTLADLDRSRLRSEAWEHFRTGEYLRAARTFDTVTSLDTSDHRSRAGEMFCHVILRADRTALAVFQELLRYDGDLFGHALGGADSSDAASLFGDPRQARALKNDARVRAGSNQTDVDARAMYLLVLWYLGGTSEAQRGAVALAREDPKSPYAGWPAEMQRVLDRGKPGS